MSSTVVQTLPSAESEVIVTHTAPVQASHGIGSTLQPLTIVEAELSQSQALHVIENDPRSTQSSEGRRLGSSTEPQYPSGAQFFFICAALILVLTLGGLDGNIVATAAPAITDDFHAIADVGWYASAYRLSSCALQFLFGRLYKIYSAKTVLLPAVLIFLLGSTICAAAVSSPMFILGRAITGAGAAGMNAGYFSIACQILPLRMRPVFNGVMAGIESISVMAAPLLGGVLTQHLSWRWCFWINLPIGLIAFVAIMLALPMKRDAAPSWRQVLRQLDLVGTLVLIPALACLFTALSWAGIRFAWTDARVIVLFVTTALLLIIFAVDQYLCKDHAILPLPILKNHNVLAGFIFITCVNGSSAVLEYYMPTYFQVVRGSSPADSGYMMLPILGGFLIALLIQGSGTSLTGYYTPFMLLASILMPVAAGLITTWQVDTSIVKVLALSGFAGFASGIGFQAPQSAVQTTLPELEASTGLAIILFAQGFGPAVFLAAAQPIFTSRLTANLPAMDVSLIENLGLNDLRVYFQGNELTDVVRAFNQTVTQTFYLVIGTTCMTMVGSLLMDWRSVKEKQN